MNDKQQTLKSGSSRARLHEQLINLIQVGALKPGEKLLEVQLAHQLKVSRTPLREALISLQATGLITSRNNAGFAVAPLSRLEAQELYPVAGELESLALKLSFEQVRTRCPQLEQLNDSFFASRTRPKFARSRDQEFHRVLLAACANKTLTKILDSIHQKLARYESLYMREQELVQESYLQHKKIIRALKENDVASASQSLRDNWLFGMHALLARLPLDQ